MDPEDRLKQFGSACAHESEQAQYLASFDGEPHILDQIVARSVGMIEPEALDPESLGPTRRAGLDKELIHVPADHHANDIVVL